MKTKKLFLMATMLLMCICSFAQNGNTPLKGDVNGDGKVDVADIVAILKIMKDPVINLTPSSDQTITEPITIYSTVTNGVPANTNWAITNEETSGETFSKSTSIGESVIITPNDMSAPEANKGTVSMTTGNEYTNSGARDLNASFAPGQNSTKEYSTRLTASYDGAEPVSINITFSKTTNALSAGTYTWTVVDTLPSGVQLRSNGASATLINSNSNEVPIPAGVIKVENTNGRESAFNTATTVPGKPEVETYYWYVGTTKPTSLSEASIVESYPAEQTYTNNSGAKSKIYVLTNSNKNVIMIDPGLGGTVDQDDVDTTTIHGYKIFSTYSRYANGSPVLIRIL